MIIVLLLGVSSRRNKMEIIINLINLVFRLLIGKIKMIYSLTRLLLAISYLTQDLEDRCT